MDVDEASRALVALTRRLLEETGSESLVPFLADWPQVTAARAIVASTLPVLRWLPAIVALTAQSGASAMGPGASTTVTGASASMLAAALAEGLVRAAPSLEWRQTYANRDRDDEFLDNYGWSELIGLRGPLCSERLAVGFLMLGAHTLYPRHCHEAEEIYVPLSGTAEWMQGDGIWREKIPGRLIHHASLEPHAMRTAAQPLLALYLWRGAHLSQSSRLDG
jgi:hypothetical protein